MEKRELNTITEKAYLEYGFEKRGKCFYLDCGDVLICSDVSRASDYLYLRYNFSVKAVHTEEDYKPNNLFDGFDSHEIRIEINPEEQGYKRHRIDYKNLSKDEYYEKLSRILPKIFDPYKKDGLEHIRTCYRIPGIVEQGDIIPVFKEARKYLGLG